MRTPGTRDAIVGAGRRLFAERGYHSVTIKEVGALAGYSPAMVMKVMGSKAELYAAAVPAESGPLTPQQAGTGDDGAAVELPGFAMVRLIVARREAGEPEPWAALPLRVLDAPDPDVARKEARVRAVNWITERMGGPTDCTTAELVATLLLGLASSLRVLQALGPERIASEELIRRYGRLVQDLIEGTR